MTDDIPVLLTLSAGAERIGLKAPDLSSGIRNGLLTHVKIGRRYFVTVSDLKAFVDKCRVTPKDQGSGSDPGPGEQRNGSSSTEDLSMARAAALATARALRKPSRDTSKPSTGRRPRGAVSPL